VPFKLVAFPVPLFAAGLNENFTLKNGLFSTVFKDYIGHIGSVGRGQPHPLVLKGISWYPVWKRNILVNIEDG